MNLNTINVKLNYTTDKCVFQLQKYERINVLENVRFENDQPNFVASQFVCHHGTWVNLLFSWKMGTVSFHPFTSDWNTEVFTQ